MGALLAEAAFMVHLCSPNLDIGQAMNLPTKKEENTYFEERAAEYDDFFRGKGPAIALILPRKSGHSQAAIVDNCCSNWSGVT